MKRKREPTQQSLLDYIDRDIRDANPTRWQAVKASPPLVNGPGYVEELDQERLTGQRGRVLNFMKDGGWYTLSQITANCKPGTEAGISATLRSLRKPKFGGHTVNKQRVGDPKSGLFQYQLLVKGS